MITTDQLADLSVGDVVELRETIHPGVVTRGPLREDIGGALWLGRLLVRSVGYTGGCAVEGDLRVIERKTLPPYYVNASRVSPAYGDVARNADDTGEDSFVTWVHLGPPNKGWFSCRSGAPYRREEMPPRLTLLVDGVTGRAVPFET